MLHCNRVEVLQRQVHNPPHWNTRYSRSTQKSPSRSLSIPPSTPRVTIHSLHKETWECQTYQFLESIHYVQDIAGHFGPNKVPSQCDSHSDDNKVWFLIQSEPSCVGGAGQNIASGPLSIVSICPGHFLYIKTTKIINPTELEVQLFNEGRTADLPLSV